MSNDSQPKLSGPVLVRLEYILVRSNISIESYVRLALLSPSRALFFFVANLFRFRVLKDRVAAAAPLRVDQLPYDHEILSVIRKLPGPIYIFSSASRLYVEQIAEHLGFAGGIYELSSHDASVQGIEETFNAGAFAYIGGAMKDLPIWRMSGGGYVVRPTKRLKQEVKLLPHPPFVIERGQSRMRFWMRAFGVRQFHCAVLSFLPVAIFAKSISDPTKGILTSLTLVCAIAIGSFARHLFNLEADRNHTILKHAPLAAGNIPIGPAVTVFCFLILLFVVFNCLIHDWSVSVLSLIALSLAMLSFDYHRKPRLSFASVSSLDLICIWGPSSMLVSPSQSLFIFQTFLTACVLAPRLIKIGRFRK